VKGRALGEGVSRGIIYKGQNWNKAKECNENTMRKGTQRRSAGVGGEGKNI
jgi:hypothetical protein